MRWCGTSRPRFVVDEMLGSLARWLRILGYDTRYEKDVHDDRLVEIARQEDRLLLTRDKDLAARTDGMSLYIESDELVMQFAQLHGRIAMDHEGLGTRCSLCNGLLAPVQKEEVAQEVPPRSLLMTDRFYRCQGCGKVYWHGTHWNNIHERLREMKIGQDRSLL